MKAVVAKYSVRKAGRFSVLGIAVAIFGITVALSIQPSPTYGSFFQGVMLMGSSIILVIVGTLAYRVVLDDGNAVWIDDNLIVHMHRLYQSVDATNVVQVSTGTDGLLRRPIVLFTMRDGRTRNIQADLLVEPVAEIAARLREALAN